MDTGSNPTEYWLQQREQLQAHLAFIERELSRLALQQEWGETEQEWLGNA